MKQKEKSFSKGTKVLGGGNASRFAKGGEGVVGMYMSKALGKLGMAMPDSGNEK